MKEPTKPKNVKVRDQELFAEVKKHLSSVAGTRLPDNVVFDAAMGALRDKFAGKLMTLFQVRNHLVEHLQIVLSYVMTKYLEPGEGFSIRFEENSRLVLRVGDSEPVIFDIPLEEKP